MPSTRPKPVLMTRFAERDYARARATLMRRDPTLGAIIKAVGPCRLKAYQNGDVFAALVETIVSQQLSIRVADVIFGRVCALAAPSPSPTPEILLRLQAEDLRGAGLSRPKVRYVQELARRVASGELDLDDLEHLRDDDVITRLSETPGIGRWSAQMILLFRLNRPDVWPIGDLGLVRALERFHRLRKPASLQRLERMGEPWRPYRSIAAWYLWKSLSLDRNASPARPGSADL
jgi:DNA-3-methyladenine glycosylase II